MKPVICPFCEEHKTEIDDNGDVLLCDTCAKTLADEADRADHQNRCEW